MDLAELAQLKKERELEHRLDMAALDRVFRMKSQSSAEESSSLNGHVRAKLSAKSSTRKRNESKPRNTSKLGLPNTLTELVLEFGEKQFTVNDVLELLGARGIKAKRGTVKNAMKMLVKRDVLKIATQGMGRRQSLFINKPQ